MTRQAGLPDVSELIPHAGRMRLLSHVIEHRAERTVCAVDVADSELFADADGGVPAWLGLEYMAQCVAAHSGLVTRQRGDPPQRGLFLGTRSTELFVDRFEPGQQLRVSSTHLRGEQALVWFDCSIEAAADSALLARGRLSVYAMRGQEAADGP
jgi:predicted hotdog family 3-hydroxylacyl-ACP dehydratase